MSEAPRVHQGPGRIIGTFLTLALFLGALAWIGQSFFVRPVDGEAKQREYFGERAPPFDLALETAVRLPTGDALVRFARAEGPGPGPVDAVFIEYRSASAAAAQLQPAPMEGPGMGGMGGMGDAGARLKEWERDKAFAWHTTMKRDEIAWGEWSSKLLIERSFEKGGGWRDEARVDLSSSGRGLVLFAHWPLDTPVDEAALRELLLAIELRKPGRDE